MLKLAGSVEPEHQLPTPGPAALQRNARKLKGLAERIPEPQGESRCESGIRYVDSQSELHFILVRQPSGPAKATFHPGRMVDLPGEDDRAACGRLKPESPALTGRRKAGIGETQLQSLPYDWTFSDKPAVFGRRQQRSGSNAQYRKQ